MSESNSPGVVAATLLLLFVLVFGISASVKVGRVQDLLMGRWHGILAGLFCQFVVMPLSGFTSVKLFGLDPVTGISLLMVTASPGGSYSNWWCSLFNADLALSIAMTTASTLLSAVLLPLNLILYASLAFEAEVATHLKWGYLLATIAVVICAVLFGLAFSFYSDSYTWRLRANMLGNVAGLGLIVFTAITGNHAENLWDKPASLYFATALPCVLGMCTALCVASISVLQLRRPQRLAIAIECCLQNIGIAASAAVSMYYGKDQSTAITVPLFYGVCQSFTLAIVCVIAWKVGWTYAPADAPLFSVIRDSYQEVGDAQNHPPPSADIPFEQIQKETNTITSN